MIKRYNNISLALGIPGFLLQMFGHGISQSGGASLRILGPPTMLLGTGLLIAGLAYYSVAKGHSPWWGLWGFMSGFGLLALALLEDKTANGESSRVTPPTTTIDWSKTRKPSGAAVLTLFWCDKQVGTIKDIVDDMSEKWGNFSPSSCTEEFIEFFAACQHDPPLEDLYDRFDQRLFDDRNWYVVDQDGERHDIRMPTVYWSECDIAWHWR